MVSQILGSCVQIGIVGEKSGDHQAQWTVPHVVSLPDIFIFLSQVAWSHDETASSLGIRS